MFGRRKKNEQAAPAQGEVQVTVNPGPSSGFDLQVFDGKGHPAVMNFRTDAQGRVIQRLRKGRDFKAHLKHVKH